MKFRATVEGAFASTSDAVRNTQIAASVIHELFAQAAPRSLHVPNPGRPHEESGLAGKGLGIPNTALGCAGNSISRLRRPLKMVPGRVVTTGQ